MFDLFKKKIDVFPPVSGKIINIESVNDEVFSSKMMGDGKAIIPDSNIITAPISGSIETFILPSAHAFGIKSSEGLEILVHVGLDTVTLKGNGFTPLKKQGDFVNKGDPIIKLDTTILQNSGLDLTTMVVVTNSDKFKISHNNKDVLFSCVKK